MIITIGRKPFITSVAQNIKKEQCGAINIEGTRIENKSDLSDKRGTTRSRNQMGFWSDQPNVGVTGNGFSGRFPSNFIVLSRMVGVLDKQGGYRKTGKMASMAKGTGKDNRCYGKQYVRPVFAEASEGFVSRYFKIIE